MSRRNSAGIAGEIIAHQLRTNYVPIAPQLISGSPFQSKPPTKQSDGRQITKIKAEGPRPEKGQERGRGQGKAVESAGRSATSSTKKEIIGPRLARRASSPKRRVLQPGVFYATQAGGSDLAE
jgi:hypothetical protein